MVGRLTRHRRGRMTTRALMILVAEAAAVLDLAVLMGELPVLVMFSLVATEVLAVAAYVIRISGRPSSRSGTVTLGLLAVALPSTWERPCSSRHPSSR